MEKCEILASHGDDNDDHPVVGMFIILIRGVFRSLVY